jgi:hypothetical protein
VFGSPNRTFINMRPGPTAHAWAAPFALWAAHKAYTSVSAAIPGAVSPLVRRKPDSQDFHAAIRCAQQFVAVETILEQSFAEMANTAVTKTEMNTLRRRIASLESAIARLVAKGAA